MEEVGRTKSRRVEMMDDMIIQSQTIRDLHGQSLIIASCSEPPLLTLHTCVVLDSLLRSLVIYSFLGELSTLWAPYFNLLKIKPGSSHLKNI